MYIYKLKIISLIVLAILIFVIIIFRVLLSLLWLLSRRRRFWLQFYCLCYCSNLLYWINYVIHGVHCKQNKWKISNPLQELHFLFHYSSRHNYRKSIILNNQTRNNGHINNVIYYHWRHSCSAVDFNYYFNNHLRSKKVGIFLNISSHSTYWDHTSYSCLGYKKGSKEALTSSRWKRNS